MLVYVKNGCPWCVDALSWLKAHGIEHTAVDVCSDPAGFDRMRQISGQSKAPTLEMPDGAVLADFDVGQLEKFLSQRAV
jgi:glutaredoxin